MGLPKTSSLIDESKNVDGQASLALTRTVAVWLRTMIVESLCHLKLSKRVARMKIAQGMGPRTGGTEQSSR